MNFDKTQYKVWTWRHPLLLHWILNPGLAFNELVLGQRAPKLSLVEKDSKKSLAERSFVPCPHCNTIHASLKWTPQNKTAFQNWFGLYCDNCGKTIPCLTNLTSYLLLGLTFPIWIWFRKTWKQQWLLKQKERFSKPLDLTVPQYNWVTEGLSRGFFMFVAMDIIFPLLIGESYALSKLLIGMVVWTLGGLLFGYVMKQMIFKKTSSLAKDKTQQAV